MGNPVHSQPTGKLVSISGAELNNAENEILKHLQRQFFKQECQRLEQADQETTPSRQNVLKNSCNIFELDPTLIQGLLRVGGCLRQAPINNDAKHPIIVPKGHHIVKLIIKYYHHISGQSGLEYTLAFKRRQRRQLRERGTRALRGSRRMNQFKTMTFSYNVTSSGHSIHLPVHTMVEHGKDVFEQSAKS